MYLVIYEERVRTASRANSRARAAADWIIARARGTSSAENGLRTKSAILLFGGISALPIPHRSRG